MENRLMNTSVLNDTYLWFDKHKNGNGVLGSETSASIWGFYDVIVDYIEMVFPTHCVTNDVKTKEWLFKVKNAQPDWRYSMGLTTINWEGTEFRVYNPERSFIDLYRMYKDNLSSWFFESAKKFFKEIKYNQKLLHEYATKFNVLQAILLLEGAYCG